jgi:hypothetical protein
MTTFEIPRDDWTVFCTTFTRTNEGKLCTLEFLVPALRVIEPDMREILEAEDLRFTGLTFEKHGERRVMTLSVGHEPSRHIEHLIYEPLVVRTRQQAEGEDPSVEIVSADGVATIVRFERAQVKCPPKDGFVRL